MSTNGNVSDAQKIQKELLWGLYQELRNHARHTETLRSNANNYILLVASALITVITFDNKIDSRDFFLSLIVVFIGLVGILFSAAYTERYHRDRLQAAELLKQLDSIFFEEESLTGNPTSATIYQVRQRGVANYYDREIFRYKILLQVRRIGSTHWFWIIFPFVVFIIGLILTVLAGFG